MNNSEQSKMSIRILLADDHTIVRTGLRLLIEAAGDMQVIGEVENGRQAVEYAARLRPHVVVMDLMMPGLNGEQATRQIVERVPRTKVLVLSCHDNVETMERLVMQGASGYLVKHTGSENLLKAIRELAAGHCYFSGTVCREVLMNVHGRRPGRPPADDRENLSRREAEVLQLVAEGHPNKRIASVLDISVKTVEKHRQQVMNKLNVHNTAGLTRHAIAQGMVDTSAP